MGTDPKTWVGKTIAGRYLIERPLAEGGMGSVFEATQTSLGRKVALKVVKSALESDDAAMQRFQLETEAVARLQHPHIVTVVDAGRAEDGTLFLAMELVPGETVRAALKREGRFAWQRALSIVDDVSSALAAAHQAGVIHRDLKAENVMLAKPAGRAEQAKVLDFGVAKLTTRTEAPPVTGSGFVAGTPGCIAPEQMLGKHDDPRSDLYSVGVLLFEMLTGRAPFVANSTVELLMKHMTEPAPRVADVAQAAGVEVPGPVDALCAALLSKDPDARPVSAEKLAELARSLKESSASTVPDLRTPIDSPTAGPPAAHPKPPTPPTAIANPAVVTGAAASPNRRRRKQIAAAVGAVVLVFAFFRLSAIYADIPTIIPWRLSLLDGAARSAQVLDVEQGEAQLRRVIALEPNMAYAHDALVMVAALNREPLVVMDRHSINALHAARSRGAFMFGTSHIEGFADVLEEFDSGKARGLWEAHMKEERCEPEYMPIELLMVTAKLTVSETDPKVIEALLQPLALLGDEANSPLAALFRARAQLMNGDLDDADATLKGISSKVKPTSSVYKHALIDVALSRGETDVARRLLDELENANDRRGEVRRAALLDLTEADAAHLDALVKKAMLTNRENGSVVELLVSAGMHLMSAGRPAAADRAWVDAFARAKPLDPARAMELASIATFFHMVQMNTAVARQWLKRVDEARLDIDFKQVLPERIRLFELGARAMVAAKSGDDLPGAIAANTALQTAPSDIPVLKLNAEFSVRLEQRDYEGARGLVKEMPGCLRALHLAMIETCIMQDDPKRDPTPHWEVAFEALKDLLDDKQRGKCVVSDDTMSHIHAIAYVHALNLRAHAAAALGKPAEAAASVARFKEMWPHAERDMPVVVNLAKLEAALAQPAPKR